MKMGFGYLFVGLIFFFNPNINLVDILPDAIGCLFLLKGLSKLADVDGRFYHARTCVIYLLVIELIKLPLSVIVPVKYPDALLWLTFVYSVAELILFFLFFTNLYNAIEYTAERHGGEGNLAYLNTASMMSILFVIVRCVLCFVPESLSLFQTFGETELRADPSQNSNLARIKPIVILVCFVAVLLAGICYLVVIKRYFTALDKDRVYNEELSSKYRSEILENETLMVRRRLGNATLLLLCAGVLLFDIRVDGVNLLPDLVAYLLLALSLRLFYRCAGIQRNALIETIPLWAVAAVNFVFDAYTGRGVLYELYASPPAGIGPVGIVQNGAARSIGIALAIAEIILFLWVAARLCRAVRAVYEKYSKPSIAAKLKIVFASFVCYAVLDAVNGILPLFTAHAAFTSGVKLYTKYQSTGPAGADAAVFYDNLSVAASVLVVVAAIWMVYVLFRIRKQTEMDF